MGVDVPFDDLGPIEYVGSTFERHCEVVSGIEDQVVAVDASQVVLHECSDDVCPAHLPIPTVQCRLSYA